MTASPHPYTEINADGTVTSLIYTKGGQMSFPAYEVTDEGYAVDKISGNYNYLEMDEVKGILVDNGLMCGKDDPKKAKGLSGEKLMKGLKGRVGHSGDETAHFKKKPSKKPRKSPSKKPSKKSSRKPKKAPFRKPSKKPTKQKSLEEILRKILVRNRPKSQESLLQEKPVRNY